MATIRKVTPKKKVSLEEDGILTGAIQDQMHEPPGTVHYDRAAEATGMDRNLVPMCGTVAELLAFVLGVQAAGGNPVAMKEVLDRFAPKAARNATNVDVNLQNATAIPMASKNSEEQSAATSYMDSLKIVK